MDHTSDEFLKNLMLYLPFKASCFLFADCDVGKVGGLFCNNSKIQWTVNETSSSGD